jgi:secondary thiamine-phosphate synthase enzyme
MKSLTKHLWFEVPGRRGFINITPKIEELVHRSGVMEGLCLVNAMHITASVFINDDEPGLHHDYELWLEKLAPHAPTSAYRHNRTGEDNADAHLKRHNHGPRSRRRNHQRQTGFRAVGTNFLRRIRRPPAQTRTGQNNWGLTTSVLLSSISLPHIVMAF